MVPKSIVCLFLVNPCLNCMLTRAVGAGDPAASHIKKFVQKFGKYENLGETWEKSKSCIPKNIRSPTAMMWTFVMHSRFSSLFAQKYTLI